VLFLLYIAIVEKKEEIFGKAYFNSIVIFTSYLFLIKKRVDYTFEG